ncbi:MAG: hypothetical protein ACK5V3_13425 [Bdellovibrionales bacterium]
MSSKLLRTAILLVSSTVLVFSFQNCGQPGGVSAATDLQKAGVDPLVVDVVAEMDNQEVNNPYDHGKKDDGKDYSYNDDDKHDEDKDYKYDDELEDLLKDYACEDLAMGSKSKKVLVCHYPPGNPSNRHEICVGRAALKAHLSHHKDSAHMDHLGECKDIVHEDGEHSDDDRQGDDNQSHDNSYDSPSSNSDKSKGRGKRN